MPRENVPCLQHGRFCALCANEVEAAIVCWAKTLPAQLQVVCVCVCVYCLSPCEPCSQATQAAKETCNAEPHAGLGRPQLLV